MYFNKQNPITPQLGCNMLKEQLRTRFLHLNLDKNLSSYKVYSEHYGDKDTNRPFRVRWYRIPEDVFNTLCENVWLLHRDVEAFNRCFPSHTATVKTYIGKTQDAFPQPTYSICLIVKPKHNE